VGALASGLRPALTSLITQNAGKREQGVIIGLTQSLMSIAQITAPLIGGALIGRADMHPPGAPENHLFLTIWGVWGGLLAGLALLFELTPSDSTPAEPLAVPEASHA
jgi:MFS family permease